MKRIFEELIAGVITLITGYLIAMFFTLPKGSVVNITIFFFSTLFAWSLIMVLVMAYSMFKEKINKDNKK